MNTDLLVAVISALARKFSRESYEQQRDASATVVLLAVVYPQVSELEFRRIEDAATHAGWVPHPFAYNPGEESDQVSWTSRLEEFFEDVPQEQIAVVAFVDDGVRTQDRKALRGFAQRTQRCVVITVGSEQAAAPSPFSRAILSSTATNSEHESKLELAGRLGAAVARAALRRIEFRRRIGSIARGLAIVIFTAITVAALYGGYALDRYLILRGEQLSGSLSSGLIVLNGSDEILLNSNAGVIQDPSACTTCFASIEARGKRLTLGLFDVQYLDALTEVEHATGALCDNRLGHENKTEAEFVSERRGRFSAGAPERFEKIWKFLESGWRREMRNPGMHGAVPTYATILTSERVEITHSSPGMPAPESFQIPNGMWLSFVGEQDAIEWEGTKSAVRRLSHATSTRTCGVAMGNR